MSKQNKKSIREYIRQFSEEEGFASVGIVRAEPMSALWKQRYSEWLGNGYQAGMKYMERNRELRSDPGLIMENARSVVCLLFPYAAENPPDTENLKIAAYARGADYHTVLKEKLHRIAERLQEITPFNYRVFTDSAPLAERELARLAGLGWIGKNSLLLTRQGSFFFLAEIVVDIEPEPDTPFEKDYCGNCTRCIDACPTGAIVQPSTVDARRCISYLTIEDRDQNAMMGVNNPGAFIFGCDICQDVCPYNRKPILNREPQFEPAGEWISWSREDWLNLQPPAFRQYFGNSAVMRAGYEKLIANIKAATVYGNNH